MYYYIHSFSGWHEVSREYYREFCYGLRRAFANALNCDEIIAQRTRKSERPLNIIDLMGGVES